MARTRKPCIGCGEVHPGRERDQLCGSCQRLLKVGQDIQAKEYRQAERGVLVQMPKRDWWPAFYCGNDFKTEVTHLLADVVFALVKKTRTAQWAQRRVADTADSRHEWWTTYRVPKKAADAIDRLLRRLKLEFALCYEHGVKHGQNLLVQLASGELTTDEMAEAVAAAERHRREIEKWET